MDETELSALDKLMLAVSEADPPKNPHKTLNEDEFFLAQIAANDLKVLEKPPKVQQLKTIDLNTPSTSQNATSSQNSSKNTSKNTSQNKNKLSLIHSGDTDSSDDESNRNFENVNLHEYGKQIKHLLPESKTRSPEQTISQSWKRMAPSTTLKFGLQAPKPNENILQDPFFGIRITKPLISSGALEERMNGRAAVSMARVKNFIAQNGQTQDWVIAGCIVQKSNARTSQSGNQYIIWTLSDLQNDLQSVSVFLFKSAFKELWKTCVGTVVGVLNPSILENREGSRHQATLSVDNHQRVMIFGGSKDHGVCKSRKRDGEPCTAFVNTNRCSYCLFHVKQEYQKCSLRSDCQSIGGGLTALRNKVLGKNEVFYAGKSYMAVQAKESRKLVERDNKRLSDLKNGGLVTSAVPTRRKKMAAASSLEVSRAQRLKDLQLLQKLNGSADVLTGLEARKNCNLEDISDEVTLEESRKTALDVIAKLKAKHNQTFDINPNISSITSTISSATSSEISSTISSATTTSPTTSITSSTSSKTATKNCDLFDISPKIKEKLIDTSKLKLSQNAVIDLNTPLQNCAKLKTKHNQNLEVNHSAISSTISSTISSIISSITSSTIPSITPSKTATKKSDLIDISPKINAPKLSELKAKDNLTLEPNPPIISSIISSTISSIISSSTISSTTATKKSDLIDISPKILNKNVIDTSKLKILKKLDGAPAPKLSQNAVIDLNTPLQNCAKLKMKHNVTLESNRAKLNTTLKTTSKTTTKKSDLIDISPKINEKQLDTFKQKIFKNIHGAHAPKLSQNTVTDLKTPPLNSPKLKTKPNLNLETNPVKTPSKTATKNSDLLEITPKINDNPIDPSKLKIFAPKLSQNAVIDLNTPPPNLAKQKALNWVQKNGPINKTNPSGIQKSGVKRFLENADTSQTKKSKLAEKVHISDRFRKIMELTSAHSDLLEQRDLDEQEKYFNKLEQREKMEEKMMSTYKMECKAVKCLNCKYTSFSAAPRCIQEKHSLKVYDAFKRFFKCGNCGNRTVALEVCPLFSCKNCGGSKWERTTMMKEKIAKFGDGLSIRGGEQTFINSVTTDANINLLMPDD